MLVVVPMEKALAMSPGILERTEALREAGSILQGPELRLRVGGYRPRREDGCGCGRHPDPPAARRWALSACSWDDWQYKTTDDDGCARDYEEVINAEDFR